MFDPAKFKVGARVQVADHPTLEDFFRTWKYHHRLTEEQLTYAGATAEVKSVGMYHGGDMLYELNGVPGIWHEQLLQPVQ
jgi:hypothetical protein